MCQRGMAEQRSLRCEDLTDDWMGAGKKEQQGELR